jgi:hypothetical protein
VAVDAHCTRNGQFLAHWFAEVHSDEKRFGSADGQIRIVELETLSF